MSREAALDFSPGRCGHIPLLVRRGGCGINKKSRSHRSAADGVVAHKPWFRNAFRNMICERPPRPLRQRWLRAIFLMSRPPLLTRRGMRAPRHAVNSFTPSQPWANICCRFAVGEPLRGLFWLRRNIVGVSLIYDSRYLRHDTGLHPENARRLGAILRALDQDESLSHKLARTLPNAAGNEDIARCHRKDLIYNIEALCNRGESFVDVDTC